MSSWKTVKEYSDITYKKREGVARIAFNRREIRDAFRRQTLFELEEALIDAGEDSSIGVILVSGEVPAEDGVYGVWSRGAHKLRVPSGYDGTVGVQRLNERDL